MKRPLLALLLLLSLGTASFGATLEHRMFHIRHKPADEAVQVARPLLGPEGSVTLQPGLRTVTVTDERPRLERIARAIQEFDAPPRHVSVAVQLLVGTHAGEGPVAPGPAAPLSPAIDRPLRDALGVTSWNEYRLLGSGSLTAVEGEESTLALGEEYRIRFAVDSVRPDQSVTRFQRFALERRRVLPGGTPEYRPLWETVLNLRDNQLYVFGATRVEDSQRAVFLSITAGILR